MTITIIGLLLLGLASGSLLNYLSDVFPSTRRFVAPFCWNCKEKRAWGGYLALRPCEHCGAKARPRAYLSIAAGLAISFEAWFLPFRPWGFWPSWLVLLFFLFVIIVDVEQRIIPTQTVVFGAVLGLGLGIWRNGILVTLGGGLIGMGIMFLVYYLGGLFTRAMAGRGGLKASDATTALGYGDVRLMGVLGLLLGLSQVLQGLLYGVVLAGVFSLVVILAALVRRRYSRFMTIAYSPALVAACWAVLYLPMV
jgi:Flp pilus assembly protein protease CpaA